MEPNIYRDPDHNLDCRYRFTCGAARCPEVMAASEPPPCYIDKFRRYQPEDSTAWYRRDWEDINKITWKQVFSLQEAWIYALITIIIAVFIFMVMVLIKLLLRANRYY